MNSWLKTEFESGGNIRFEEIKNDDPRFKFCEGMLRTRILWDDRDKLGVSYMRVHRVVHIHNQVLLNKFEVYFKSN